ncbi:MAG: cytochrome [Sphingobacteriales bacterium]|nr:cytochrome [Sphingobacteriales bacterium]
MKKIILALTCCIAILAACNNETKTSENTDSITYAPDTVAATSTPATAPADTASKMAPATPATEKETGSTKKETGSTEKGKALIAKSDCLGCHKLDEKLVGPAYKAVAEKYTSADIDKLAGKIIAGGAGNWGEVPMSPHPAISKDDAKEMVKYILSLK